MSQICCVGDHSLESHDDVGGAEWPANFTRVIYLHWLIQPSVTPGWRRGVWYRGKSALHFFHERSIRGSVLTGRLCLSVLWWNVTDVGKCWPSPSDGALCSTSVVNKGISRGGSGHLARYTSWYIHFRANDPALLNMGTYLHLTPPTQPYLISAKAASDNIWATTAGQVHEESIKTVQFVGSDPLTYLIYC